MVGPMAKKKMVKRKSPKKAGRALVKKPKTALPKKASPNRSTQALSPKTKKSKNPKVIDPEIVDPDEETPFSEPKTEVEDFDPATVAEPDSRAVVTTDPLARYLSEIRRYPLLTRDKEYELAVLYREKGDKKAAEMLVTANLRFVVKVAAEYTKFGARLIDLVQEGNVGLMHAVREFNPYKGVRLITYAVWWIRGYIQEYLMRQYSMVRIGTTANQRKLFYQLQRQREELERMGANEAVAQISGRLGIAPEEVSAMQQRLSSRDVSLDKPLSDDQDTTLLAMQSSPDEEGVDERLGTLEEVRRLRQHLEELRPSLNEREQMILDERLLADEPLTLQEIGEKYKITREAVRQIEQRLMEKIRDQLINS